MIRVKFRAVFAIPFLFSFASEAIGSPAQREPNASLALEGGPAGDYFSENPGEQGAATTRKITGVVLDPSGAAIAGAEVILLTVKGALAGRTVTDNKEAFASKKSHQERTSSKCEHQGFEKRKWRQSWVRGEPWDCAW